jgi:hypothetical protein
VRFRQQLWLLLLHQEPGLFYSTSLLTHLLVGILNLQSAAAAMRPRNVRYRHQPEYTRDKLFRYVGIKAILSWIHNWQKVRKDPAVARKRAYVTYVRPALIPRPTKRRRTHSPCAEGEHRQTKFKDQSKSRLLSLPAEIREMIWQHAMTGMHIALYRDKRRLTYGLLDGSNCKTPGELFPITEILSRTESYKLSQIGSSGFVRQGPESK